MAELDDADTAVLPLGSPHQRLPWSLVCLQMWPTPGRCPLPLPILAGCRRVAVPDQRLCCDPTPPGRRPCPVLQYADDTLILVRAETEDVINLRNILDSFSEATGLRINYHKSIAVPLHVPDTKLRRLLKVLQCQPAQFPQVYLGLPLSNVKLNLNAFAPLIAKVDRRLSGWKALLLNHAGPLVLVNSVLDGLPAHLMSAVLLPAGTIDALGKRRRSGQKEVNGAQCLVAWDRACLPKLEGGLGIKQLTVRV